MAEDKIELHLTQYRRNRRFAKSIGSQFRDWQVNVVFYTGLHLVDAAMCKLGIPINDHTSRNDAVRSNQSFERIRNQYLHLFRICRITRYDPDPDNWIPKQYLTVNDLAKDLLTPIEEHVFSTLVKMNFTEGPLILKT